MKFFPARAVAVQAGALITAAVSGCGGTFDEPDMQPAPPLAVAMVAAPAAGSSDAVPAALPVPAAPAEAAHPVDVHAQLAALRAEVAELRRRLNQLGGAAPARELSDATPDASQAVQARLARAESAFRQEQHDPAWSTAAVAQLRAAISEVGGSTEARMRHIECRSRTCRLDLAPDTAHPPQDALPLLVGQLGGVFATADAIPIDQGNGQQASLLFFAR